MGYDVHLTRKEEWFDEDSEVITLDEWKHYVESDHEMRLDNFAEAETPNGVLRVESEGLSVWLDYSGHEKDENIAWMSYSNGNITVKNPDEEILRKMYQISLALNAKAQGDECEIYDTNGQSNWQELREQNIKLREQAPIKWWQFWK